MKGSPLGRVIRGTAEGSDSEGAEREYLYIFCVAVWVIHKSNNCVTMFVRHRSCGDDGDQKWLAV